jgi:hypothetical protein
MSGGQTMKKLSVLFLISFVFSFFSVLSVQATVLNFTDYQQGNLVPKSKGLMHQITVHGKDIPGSKSNGKNWGKDVILVELSGKINHFGIDITQTPPQYIDYHATVPGVQVWIAEYPSTKDLNILTDETGWWTIYVLKYKGVDLEFSFVYQKEGWVTTKSNVITVKDDDNTDIAIQYIDPLYYYYALKLAVEQQISAMLEFSFTLQNAMVVTVGKSWASMHDDRLPHGDPGATVELTPAPVLPFTIGPIYFNEAVQPDPSLSSTSVDGGVTWLNVPLGTHTATAQKTDVIYETVTFRVTEADLSNGVELYIASPPDSVQGNNDSDPGEY